MSLIQIRPEARAMLRALAGIPAERYFAEILGPGYSRATRERVETLEDAEDVLLDPYSCLEIVFGHYAFNRRGKDRHELSEIGLKAFRRACAPDAIESLQGIA